MEHNVISSASRVRGEIRVDGTLRIEGRFEGIICGAKGRVVIAKSGEAVTDITAEEVTIGGRLVGNVYASKAVKILKTGVLEGSVFTPSFSADEGGVFKGECSIKKKEKA